MYGGEKCSVIPDYSAVKYLVRAETMKDIKKIRDLFERCAQAACSAVGTTYKIWNNEPGNKNMVSNRALADIFDKFYEELGGGKMPHVDSNGSTDMGDVSQVVPAIHPWISLDCPDLQLHTEEFAEMTMTPAADRAIRIGSAAMAMTGAGGTDQPWTPCRDKRRIQTDDRKRKLLTIFFLTKTSPSEYDDRERDFQKGS